MVPQSKSREERGSAYTRPQTAAGHDPRREGGISELPALAEPQFHVAIADPGGREEGERDAELSRFCAPLLYNISGVPPKRPPKTPRER
jgi:hypothetical protein